MAELGLPLQSNVSKTGNACGLMRSFLMVKYYNIEPLNVSTSLMSFLPLVLLPRETALPELNAAVSYCEGSTVWQFTKLSFNLPWHLRNNVNWRF